MKEEIVRKVREVLDGAEEVCWCMVAKAPEITIDTEDKDQFLRIIKTMKELYPPIAYSIREFDTLIMVNWVSEKGEVTIRLRNVWEHE